MSNSESHKPELPEVTRPEAFLQKMLDDAAKSRTRADIFADIVDFVEEHGGSLSGESRDRLAILCIALWDAS